MDSFFKRITRSKTEKIYCSETYSASGEDILINQIFQGQMKGTYVDIGAHHPFRFSNTYLLYKKGWFGINIDPRPGFEELFNRYRPTDINLEIAISDNEGNATLFYNDFGALNTLEEKTVNQYPDKYHSKKRVETKTLESVINTYLGNYSHVDFINIDVEGHDEKVLKSFDLELIRPKLVCIEDLNFEFSKLNKNRLVNHFTSKKYWLYALIPHTLFFLRND